MLPSKIRTNAKLSKMWKDFGYEEASEFGRKCYKIVYRIDGLELREICVLYTMEEVCRWFGVSEGRSV